MVEGAATGAIRVHPVGTKLLSSPSGRVDGHFREGGVGLRQSLDAQTAGALDDVALSIGATGEDGDVLSANGEVGGRRGA